jgi:lipoprotein-anchoring transpeptidase ErfK/SrfK
MSGLALRSIVVSGLVALVVGITTVPASAAPLDVTLHPTFGPVGRTVHITAASGMSQVDHVIFGSSDPVAVTPVDDTQVDAVVPGDASNGTVTLSYSDATPDTATDESFTVQLPTSATISRSRAAVLFPGTAFVRATLKAAGVPVPDQPARLQRRVAGTSGWHAVGEVRSTHSDGRVGWKVQPRDTARYRVRFSASHSYLGTVTDPTGVGVRPRVGFAAPDVAPILTKTRLHGRVHPAPAAGSKVLLDQRVDGAWRRVARSETKGHGGYAFHVTFDAVDRYDYRVRRPHDGAHLSGRSAAEKVQTVERTLRSGMSGWDVRMLQKRLEHLHYDVGHADSNYGYDTLHAVVAFQKVQGMDRDGVVGPKVWRRLGDPRKPHLRHPGDAASSGVEIDLTKQVVYYAVNGKIRSVIDASSGGGYYYTGSDGTTQKADTPTGHYHVIYKYDGWQHAPLGELYRPAYFRNDGYAIHGSNSIPPYPASHGCVRISVPAADRFWTRFVTGMSVWLYRS